MRALHVTNESLSVTTTYLANHVFETLPSALGSPGMAKVERVRGMVLTMSPKMT